MSFIDQHNYQMDQEGFVVAGKSIRILEQRLDEADDAEDDIDAFFFASENLATMTAQKVWDSALLAVKYLEDHAELLVRDQRVLELGCGTGFVGLACAALGARSVVLTDTASVISYCTMRNVAANSHFASSVSCLPLDWIAFESSNGKSFETDDAIDVLIASDCVWLVELMKPFVTTVAGLLKRNKGAVCVLAQTERSKDDSKVFSSTEQLLALLRESGLVVQAAQNQNIFLVKHIV